MESDGEKILIVEDNGIQAMTIKRFLEGLRYDIIAVVDQGEKAVAKTLEFKPDLIIMDIFLDGDMTGIDAMHKIRETSEVPVIYISGNSDPYYMERARKTNFLAFLYKPIKLEDLHKQLNRAFKGASEDPKSGFRKWGWPFNLFS